MKPRTIFITATDTNAGKTYISVSLLRLFKHMGYQTNGLKPIASGCHRNIASTTLENDDALQLQQASTLKLPYQWVNPFAFEEAIAPHIAAQFKGVSLSVAELNRKMKPALLLAADVRIIEGAGGWLLPLNHRETYADFVLHQDMEIILVVHMRLGCLNHALLTAQSILRRQGKLLGWIANTKDTSMAYLEENIATLKRKLPIPHLWTVMPHTEPSLCLNLKDFA